MHGSVRMSGQDCIVLGAGIVGVSAALHLQSQGWSITLVDKNELGRETSFGNAGLIELSTAFPHPCPQDAATLLRYALNRSADVRYDFLAMPALAGRLFGYWPHSMPDRIAPIGEAFRNLVANSLRESHHRFAPEQTWIAPSYDPTTRFVTASMVEPETEQIVVFRRHRPRRTEACACHLLPNACLEAASRSLDCNSHLCSTHV
jgi:hypothetical protein